MSMTNNCLTIAAVSEQTGITKEVLRKWETRYGFPVPGRDASGIRLYSAEQTSRLKLIKKLLDDGMRSGQIVPLEEARLTQLLADRYLAVTSLPSSELAKNMVQWLQAHDPELLWCQLHLKLARRGLRDFILNAMPALNAAVGNARSHGDISIKEERLYAETAQALLRRAIPGGAGVPRGPPHILLMTLPGESNTLGLLMVEALMSLEGATCTSFGAQMPLLEIASACQAYQPNIVCLSFGAAFPRKRIFPFLWELRSLCPAEIGIWAAGSGAARMERIPRGVSVIPTLEGALKTLQSYRRRQPEKTGYSGFIVDPAGQYS